MKYVVTCSVQAGNYRDAARQLAEMKAARRELKAARQELRK